MLKRPYYYTEDKKEDVQELQIDEQEKKETKHLTSDQMLSMVGGNIRAIRKFQRITISQLAKRANISEKYLQGVEVGKRNISITNLHKISSTLKVALDLFFIENKNNTNERILFIESKLKTYTKEQLEHFDMLIEDIRLIVESYKNDLGNLADEAESSSHENVEAKTTVSKKDSKTK